MQHVMTLDDDRIAELKLLALYNAESMREGIKVHHGAGNGAVEAAQRLHAKGLVSQSDGGYLTDEGVEAMEHLRAVLTILRSG